MEWNNPISWNKLLFFFKLSIYQEQDNYIDIDIDVFLVHSNERTKKQKWIVFILQVVNYCDHSDAMKW